MIELELYTLAHARTGDKGNRVNISLIAYDASDYALLVEQVTEQRVLEHFAHRAPTRVQRYLLPKLGAMNFVLDDMLDGGVNDSLNLDMHGKALSFHLLTLPVQVPAARALSPDHTGKMLEALGLDSATPDEAQTLLRLKDRNEVGF